MRVCVCAIRSQKLLFSLKFLVILLVRFKILSRGGEGVRLYDLMKKVTPLHSGRKRLALTAGYRQSTESQTNNSLIARP